MLHDDYLLPERIARQMARAFPMWFSHPERARLGNDAWTILAEHQGEYRSAEFSPTELGRMAVCILAMLRERGEATGPADRFLARFPEAYVAETRRIAVEAGVVTFLLDAARAESPGDVALAS